MKEITIKIYNSEDQGGFMYDIYDTADVDDDTESIDGGHCTSQDIRNALDMAICQAKDLVSYEKKVKISAQVENAKKEQDKNQQINR
jgi:hypothetical protein